MYKTDPAPPQHQILEGMCRHLESTWSCTEAHAMVQPLSTSTTNRLHHLMARAAMAKPALL